MVTPPQSNFFFCCICIWAHLRLILLWYAAAFCLGNLWKSHVVKQTPSGKVSHHLIWAKRTIVLRGSLGLNIGVRERKTKNSTGVNRQIFDGGDNCASHILLLFPEVVIYICNVSLSLHAHGVESVMAFIPHAAMQNTIYLNTRRRRSIK